MNKQKELESIQLKSTRAEVIDANKSMLGLPVWVSGPAHLTDVLPWRGTVTRVVDEEYFIVKPFGRGRKEEKASMYDLRSVSSKKK